MLFGKLKKGGHVRVVETKDENGRDKIGFEFLEGPVKPKAEKYSGCEAEGQTPLTAAEAEGR